MSKYLLQCGCGSDMKVDVGQAGGQIDCPSCGTRLDVPPLRKLRHLPLATVDEAPAPSKWSGRQGMAAAGLILGAVFLTLALWSRLNEPAVPEFDPAERLQNVDRRLEALTPVQGWNLWVDLYRPMAERGFAFIEDPHKPAIEQYIARQRFFQKTMLAVAAVCIAVALAAVLWPTTTSARRTSG